MKQALLNSIAVTLIAASLVPSIRAQVNPNLSPISNKMVPAGKTLVVPLTASTPKSGVRLNYVANSSTPGVTVQVLMNPTVLRMDVANFGVMTFHLFDERAPRTARTIADLATAGFYDGVIFHRVIENFMIQGGDPAGTGSGGPPFRFEDEFHPELIFTGEGQLAMANSGLDTNGSQFFITTSQPRHLDFLHTIFGQLLRGFDTLSAIESTPASPSPSNRPLSEVRITRAGLVPNRTDAVLLIKATSSAQNAVITVDVDDGQRATDRETFAVTIGADTANEPAILGPVSDVITPINMPVSLQLTAQDVEGNTLGYDAILVGASTNNATLSVSGSTVTVTPNTGYFGPLDALVGVQQRAPNVSRFDVERVTIGVGASTLAAEAHSLATVPGVPLSNAHVATLTFGNSRGSASQLSATINWGDGQTSAGQIEHISGLLYAVRGSHTYTRSGRYSVRVEAESNLGSTAKASGVVDVRPPLTLQPSGDNVALTWPGWASVYQLQSVSALDGSDWNSVTAAPSAEGFDAIVTLPTAQDAQFFRLMGSQ